MVGAWLTVCYAIEPGIDEWGPSVQREYSLWATPMGLAAPGKGYWALLGAYSKLI